MADFPLRRFQQAGVPALTVSQLQDAWALLSPAVQDAEVLLIEGMSNYQIQSITSFPTSGGAVPTATGFGGQIIEIAEGAVQAGSQVPGATPSTVLAVDASGNLASGPATSSVESAIQPGVIPDGSTDNTAALQAWVASFTAGAVAHLPDAGASYILTAPLTITGWTGTLRLDGTLKKAASFTGAAAVVISGGNVKIEAPAGVTVIDGNQAGGAAGDGIDIQGGAIVVMRGGVIANNKASGIVCTGSSTDVRCYQVESSINVSGTNNSSGFYVNAGAKLRTWDCIANGNDSTGFMFDRTAAPGCRLDGYAASNIYSTGGSGGYGARVRSYQGRIARFEGNSNQGGTLSIEFGGDSWEGAEVFSYNSGNGTNTSGFGVELFGATRCQIGRVVGAGNSGYTLAHTANPTPLATTVSNGGSGVTNVATSIPCASLSNWPTGGVALIESELVIYTGITANTLTGCVRGAFNTTAASHADGVAVTQNVACRSNSIGVVLSDQTGNWDLDPAIHYSGGSVHNRIGVATVTGHTMAVSFGEGLTPANNDFNRIGTLIVDKISQCIWRNDGGSNNRIGQILATDCWNASGTFPALLYFNAATATVQGNTVGKFSQTTDTAPAPTATLTQANGATGNLIDSARSVLLGSAYKVQSFPRTSGSLGNLTAANTSGTLYGVGGDGPGLILPAGIPVSLAHLWTGTTAASGVTHWWYALVDQSTNKIIANTADSTSQAGAANTDQSIALAYTPDVDTAVWLAYCIVVTTTMPTLWGQDWNGYPSNQKATTPVVGAIWAGQTNLTTPLTVGTNLGAPTNYRNVPWAGLS